MLSEIGSERYSLDYMWKLRVEWYLPKTRARGSGKIADQWILNYG